MHNNYCRAACADDDDVLIDTRTRQADLRGRVVVFITQNYTG